MLPMVPCEIPAQPWEDIRVEPDLQLPSGIAADETYVSDGRVQKLLVSPTRRVLDQDFGARP